MAKIAFWTPEQGMTGQTHAIIAIATLMGIKYKASNLIVQANYGSRKIESSYTPYSELISMGKFENSDSGIGALTKIIVSNKLTPTAIKNYAKPVLKERLDVLYGVSSKEIEQYTMMMKNIQFILRKANEIYDMLYIDLPKGKPEKYVQDAVIDSELVICTVNQDIVKLDAFFEELSNEKILQDKQKIILITDYDSKSKYNIRNIKSRYRVKDMILTVPHNVYFSDSCNDGSVVDFISKNFNADKNDYNGNFIYSVGEVVETIKELLAIKDV